MEDVRNLSYMVDDTKNSPRFLKSHFRTLRMSITIFFF